MRCLNLYCVTGTIIIIIISLSLTVSVCLSVCLSLSLSVLGCFGLYTCPPSHAVASVSVGVSLPEHQSPAWCVGGWGRSCCPSWLPDHAGWPEAPGSWCHPSPAPGILRSLSAHHKVTVSSHWNTHQQTAYLATLVEQGTVLLTTLVEQDTVLLTTLVEQGSLTNNTGGTRHSLTNSNNTGGTRQSYWQHWWNKTQSY